MSEKRLVLLVSHTARDEAIVATLESAAALVAAGITPVMTQEQLKETKAFAKGPALSTMDQVKELGSDVAEADLELAVVLGGDGTILKAAEIVRESQTPLLGINLGHVGFLAESEKNEISSTIERVAKRDYLVKERLTLDVSVLLEGKEVYRTWALNEAAVEKSAREKMLEVVVEIDSRPLSSFGCDGIVVSTPTGSTAYAFSAGGPVVWPSVDALRLEEVVSSLPPLPGSSTPQQCRLPESLSLPGAPFHAPVSSPSKFPFLLPFLPEEFSALR